MESQLARLLRLTNELLEEANEANSTNSEDRSRHLSIAITKLEEVAHRLRDALEGKG